MHLRETALQTSKIPWCGYMYRYMCDGTMGMGLFDSPVDLLTVHLMIEHRGQRWGMSRHWSTATSARRARALGLEESHVYELKCSFVCAIVRSVLGCSVGR